MRFALFLSATFVILGCLAGKYYPRLLGSESENPTSSSDFEEIRAMLADESGFNYPARGRTYGTPEIPTIPAPSFTNDTPSLSGKNVIPTRSNFVVPKRGSGKRSSNPFVGN